MRIFLSYASEQKVSAETIAFSLRKRGHNVFLDKDDLPPGKSYDDQIQTAVFASDLMIFLISPESVTKGRYTLTELEYARHRWRTPHNVVVPVMLKPTDMATVPSFLKAVTIHEPSGNLAAEVSFWIEQMRGAGYVARVTTLVMMIGAAFSLLHIGAKEGWILRPDIPLPFWLADQLHKLLKPLLPVKMADTVVFVYYAIVCLLMAPAVTLSLRLFASTSRWRAIVAGLTVALATMLGIQVANQVYVHRIDQYREIEHLKDELRNSRARLKEFEDRQAAVSPNRTGPAADPTADRTSGFDRALDLEWSFVRLQIGSLFGALFSIGLSAAGSIASLAMRSSRRWMLTALGGAVVGGAAYAITNNLAFSFFALHICSFALLGYWIARGQE